MGFRPNRSAETAVELLTELVHTAWDNKKTASLLSMDLTGAYDRTIAKRLEHVFRKRRISEWLIRWTISFMEGRTTTTIVDGIESLPFPIARGVPQGSPFSPIAFIFYTADLLEACDPLQNNVLPIGFADNVPPLAFGDTAESNCVRLRRVHEICIDWAKHTGMQPNPRNRS